jgi:4-amino-4-deoxy-L-arabinose transferase-like glycosyltransferase
VTKVLPTASPSEVAELSARKDGPGAARRLLRGRPEDPAWVRGALAGLLAATGLLYLWDLGASGWANAFYSAAVQAGASNGEAFFYGSSDAANSITVDKPPAALWVMDLSVRLFGLSSWSILVPQALMGVATVGLVYLAVRRVTGPWAALLAGALTALTPVGVLIFRFNNPDALLTLLLACAAYATTRAVESGRGRWLVLVGLLVGLGFLTKMLQSLLVLPGFALAYLVTAPGSLPRRLLSMAAGGVALVVSAGWWITVVELTPASHRPWIGGSQANSVWDLLWGYNGLGRLSGNETGSVSAQPPRHFGSFGRLFNSSFGGQASWLLPAALLLLVGALVALRGAPRTDRSRAALLIWGGWLVVTALTLSLAGGIIHPYYTVVLAPATAAVLAIAGPLLWRRRGRTWVRNLLAIALFGTAAWSFVLLDRTPYYLPWLRWVVAAAGVVATVALLRPNRVRGRAVTAVSVAGVIAVLGGPAAYSWCTTTSPHDGSLPTAGPHVLPVLMGATTIAYAPENGASGTVATATPAPLRQAGLGPLVTPRLSGPGGMYPGLPVPASDAMGNLLAAAKTVAPGVRGLLEKDARSYTWVAATLGSEDAAGFQLATGRPVLPLGGFNASDPFPSFAQFRADVAAHRLHWFIGGGVEKPSTSGSEVAHQIAVWVVSRYPERVVDGVVLYDLSRPLA